MTGPRNVYLQRCDEFRADLAREAQALVLLGQSDPAAAAAGAETLAAKFTDRCKDLSVLALMWCDAAAQADAAGMPVGAGLAS